MLGGVGWIMMRVACSHVLWFAEVRFDPLLQAIANLVC